MAGTDSKPEGYDLAWTISCAPGYSMGQCQMVMSQSISMCMQNSTAHQQHAQQVSDTTMGLVCAIIIKKGSG